MHRLQRTRRSRYGGMLALNAILLGAFALISFAPEADGQRSRRARGEYTMVAGQILGRTEAAIYLVDSNNAEMIAVMWDQSRRDLTPLGFRDLQRDAAQAGGSR